jgi:hypothetical protein
MEDIIVQQTDTKTPGIAGLGKGRREVEILEESPRLVRDSERPKSLSVGHRVSISGLFSLEQVEGSQ